MLPSQLAWLEAKFYMLSDRIPPDHIPTPVAKRGSRLMHAVTCPENVTLRNLLLGKLDGPQLAELEEHLLHCESCAATAQTLDGGDSLTEAIVRSKIPNGDEDVLKAAIQQAKRLSSHLKTVRIDETQIVNHPNSRSPSPPGESRHARDNLDFLAPAQQSDELGRLGNYRVLKVLGVGGMGIVFRAEDTQLKRPVALKVMRPVVAAKREAKARFLYEAQSTAALSHDHIVHIYQVGEQNGVPFIAMQYLAGESLESRLNRVGKLPADEVARIGKEVASGLVAAHEKGLVHRDIKPDNVWLEKKTDRAKILDFGLVRDSRDDAALTQPGAILGTPRYMAPEQVFGHAIDHRCDLFSLGSMLYHLTAGTPPFEGPNIAALLYSITQSAPRPLDEIDPPIHRPLADLIMRLLSKEPKNRPQSAEAVAGKLAEIESELRAPSHIGATPIQPIAAPEPRGSQNRQPPSLRWPLVAAAGAAAFALIFGVIVITIRNRDGQETTIRVAEGSTTTLDLAPGSTATIQEEPTLPSASETETPSDSQLSEAKLFPPLEKWLEGRKQLTVAQDGSAMFTSIQAALDDQRSGEVVRVLDKGPYKESLRWENKKNCGLVSTVGTVIEVAAWQDGLNTDGPVAHWVFNMLSSRIHGVTFLYSSTSEAERKPVEIKNCDGFCLEHCVFARRELPENDYKTAVAIADFLAESTETHGRCIRNCVFAADEVLLLAKAGRTFFSRNWTRLRRQERSKTYFGLRVHTSSNQHPIHVDQNIFDTNPFVFQAAVLGRASGQGDRTNLSFTRNTVAVPFGQPVVVADRMTPDTCFTNNLQLVENPALHFESYLDANVVRGALRSWKMEGNHSKLRATEGGVTLQNTVSPEMTPLSTDPLDHNFMRVDPATISLRPGDPFPGALPSGPAPPEGDWFTELQERFKDALEYMTPEAREFWSQPVELPTYDIEKTSALNAVDFIVPRRSNAFRLLGAWRGGNGWALDRELQCEENKSHHANPRAYNGSGVRLQSWNAFTAQSRTNAFDQLVHERTTKRSVRFRIT